MGILDEAIKEHLELKRQHGAGESELKQIEDEAFGAAERPGSGGAAPDPFAEAPTQFMVQPETEGAAEASVGGGPASATETEADQAQGEDASIAEAPAPQSAAPPARERSEIADLQEPPVEAAEPAEEQAPAMEHEAIAAPAADRAEPAIQGKEAADEPEAEEQQEQPLQAGPSTEERHAIAEQPTEMHDVEAELGEAEPTDAEPEVHALSEEDEEFWDEKRLSDELDQALEAPVELEEPVVEERTPESEPEPSAQSPASEGEEAPEVKQDQTTQQSQHEDVLEDTPDFLEEAPDDDQLWFEQKPPKDFDFDD